jgi:hypothetical protein
VRHRTWLLLPLLGLVGCAPPVTSGRAPAPLQKGQWVLVQSPPKGELGENTFPPISTWRRVRTFDDAESCSNFRVDMLWDAESAGSRAMLEEVSNLHCIPAARLAGRGTDATAPKGR